MNRQEIISWLMEGDVAIQYQASRDLLGEEKPDLQRRIESEGWGAAFLSKRQQNGHWGHGFYQPKWISSHYTLLDLKNLRISCNQQDIQNSLTMILKHEKGIDGGINPSGTINKSDVCINGMVLNYACYFQACQQALKSVVDFILSQQLADGGFNCQFNRKGAVHSSLHSTLSVAEGILEYERNGYRYRLTELLDAAARSREFMLQHQLFKSDHTGEIIDRKMLMLSYPCRWRYDILRALDYFRDVGLKRDSRVDDALDILLKKQKRDCRWPVQAKHPGQVYFDMEKSGQPSRWNTLRALRVLDHFKMRGCLNEES